ncbi:MAG: tetratricopeptide repeat protein [Cyclobacteriaceae bacterium]|nr:tetratricopeptide repeat protein [Cyclobacteriaceae bacterium]
MKTLLLLTGILLSASCVYPQDQNGKLIEELKNEIIQKEIYVQRKRNIIDGLGNRLKEVDQLPLDQQFDLYNSLYHQYKTFIYDSASKYAGKLIQTAYKLDDKSRIGYARVKLSFIRLSAGMFKETFDSLSVIETQYLPDTTKVDYYWLLARSYTDLNNYNKDMGYQRIYIELNQHYLDSALMWCKPGSFFYYYLTAVKNIHINNYQKVIDTVEELFKKQNLTLPQFAVTYYDLSNAYNGLNQPERAVESLIRSSLSDIRAATKETAAMYTLARILHEQGDQKNAYIFIRQALDDAEFYGARQRMVEIGSILPLIASAELNSSEANRRIWLNYTVGLAVLLLLVIIFMLIIFKQFRKLKAAEQSIKQANDILQETIYKLTEANRIKEEFIGYYFSINSEYLEKIESFKRSVEQKLNSKKYDDIKFIINNINTKREREELYFSFDKVFLKLFPNFVRTFNTYFHPEDQITLKEGQLLNTELRIFALFRMGITEAEDIARILNYSVNTIYAYKTKIRTKSILPNEEFDRKIMEIKAD